jgi:endonuclease/exonuclease/phosphatase family metal-dependent hydrolase
MCVSVARAQLSFAVDGALREFFFMTIFLETRRLLSVASYNIHRCVGVDGRCDPLRIAQVIRELDADIVGLQEVHSRVTDDEQAHQLDFLADATGLHAIPGHTLYHHDGHYGNALLTNAPILVVRPFDLSVPGREPRGGIDAKINIAGENLRVIVTHLGLWPAERRLQVKRLLPILAEEPTRLIVMLGDINEWQPRARSLRWLQTYFGDAPAPRTFPTRLPLFALDRIWAKPREALLRVHVSTSPLARLASDHLPVTATIRVMSESP